MDNTLNQLFSDKLTSSLYVQGAENLPTIEYDNWLYDVANDAIFVSIILCLIMIFISRYMFSKNKAKIGKVVAYLISIPALIAISLSLYLTINSEKINKELVYNPIVSIRGVNSDLIDYYRSFNDNDYQKTQRFVKSDFLSATANKFPTKDGEIFCGVVLRPKNMNETPIILNLLTFKDLNIQGCLEGDPVIDN